MLVLNAVAFLGPWEHICTIHGLTASSYKAKWGYGRGTGLCSRCYSQKDSLRARRRAWGARLRPFYIGHRKSPARAPVGMRRGTKL